MAYRGTGVPKFGTLGASYSMPAPVKGGRNETFEPIQEVYENILNKLIPGERVLRFVGEYEFSTVPDATLQLLITAYNMGRTIMWAPHADLDKLRYEVIIDELKIVPVNGLIDYDGLQLKVRAIPVTNMIPTADNMFRLGHSYPYLAALAVITAGAFVIATDYSIRTLGTTVFGDVGGNLAADGDFTIGKEYLINDILGTRYTLIGGNLIDATDFIKGMEYIIETPGTTNFVTEFGASDSNAETNFVASKDGEVGSGTGKAYAIRFTATGAGGGVDSGRAYETLFTASGVGLGTGTAIEIES